MIKKIAHLILVTFLIPTLLPGCDVPISKPEENLWGQWEYMTNEAGNSTFIYDLEFRQDGKLTIQGGTAIYDYVVIAPGRMKISNPDRKFLVNYEITANNLTLHFEQGQNTFKYVPGIVLDEISTIETEESHNQGAPVPDMTSTPKISEETIPSPIFTTVNFCSESEFAEDPLCDSSWPMYGHDPTRSAWNVAEKELTPPLQIIWSQSINNYYPDDISIANEMIFLGGDKSPKNHVYATNLAGQVVWEYTLLTGGGAMSNAIGYYNNAVYFGGQHDDLLYSLNSNTGQILWTTPGVKGLYASPVNIENGTIYAFGEQSSVFSINANTGQINWSQEADGWAGRSAIWEQTLVVISWNTPPMALNKNTGEILWQRNDLRTYFSDIIANNGLVYFGSGKAIYALDILDGQTVWSTTLPNDPQLTAVTDYSLAYADGIVFAAGGVRAKEDSPESQNILLALNAESGKIVWQTKVGANWSNPIVANNFLYAFYQQEFEAIGTVIAFNAKTGEEAWRWQPHSESYYPSYVIADGTFYLTYYQYSEAESQPTCYIIAFQTAK